MHRFLKQLRIRIQRAWTHFLGLRIEMKTSKIDMDLVFITSGCHGHLNDPPKLGLMSPLGLPSRPILGVIIMKEAAPSALVTCPLQPIQQISGIGEGGDSQELWEFAYTRHLSSFFLPPFGKSCMWKWRKGCWWWRSRWSLVFFYAS